MSVIKSKQLWVVFSSALAVIVVAVFVIFFPSIQKDVVFSQQKKLTAKEYIQIALTAEEKKDLTQAIWNFRQALELQKNNTTALEHLPRLYLVSGELGQALEYAQKLASASPKSPEGLFYQGMAYNLLGQREKAKESYQKALKVDPKYAEAYFNLGFLAESNGHLLEAIENYQKALDIDSKHARAAYNLGNSFAGLARGKEAIDAYKIAVVNDPNYTDAFVNLSILLTEAGQYREAVKYLDEAQLLGYLAPQAYLKSLEPYRDTFLENGK